MINKLLIIITIIIAAVLGICLGKEVSIGEYSYLYLLPIIIYYVILCRKPEVILLISAVLITGMFALIPPDFFRIKGILKFRDMLLLAPIPLIVVSEILIRRRSSYSVMRLSTITGKAIISLCIFIFILVIFTVIRYSYSLNLSLRIARDYFYYIFFFTTVYSLRTKDKINWFIRSLILLSIIFAIMYSILALSGGRINLFPAYRTRPSVIWGVPLARGYVSFGFAYTICIVLISLLGFIPQQNQKIFLKIGFIIFSIVILLIAIFFSLGRGGWYLLTFSMFIIFLISPYKKLFIQRLSLTLAIFLLSLFIISKVRYGISTLFIARGGERFYSGIEEVRVRRGTFAFRMNYLKKSLKVIKDNLFFGVGFLYPETLAAKYFPWRAVTMVDIGYVSLLSTMGLIGLILYIIFYYIIIRRAISVIRVTKNLFYKGIIAGFIVKYINGWMGTLVSAGVSEYIVITVYAMCMGITEAIYKVETESIKVQNLNHKVS